MAATTPDTPPKAPRRMSRRRLMVLFAVFLLLAGGWQAVERFINIERYRPMIDAELEKLIKLPLTFGDMDLKLFPTPRLVVENVAAGEGDFSVFSPEVSVTAGLGQLLRGQLALNVVTIHDARLQMPETTDAFKARWAEYLAALRVPRESSGKAGIKVTLESIDAPKLQIVRGSQAFAGGALQVLRVTAGAPEFVFDLHGAAEHAGTAAQGTLTLDVHQDPRIRGSASLSGMALTALTGDPAMPPLLLDAETTFALAQDATVTVEAKGRLRLPDQADALGPFEVSVRRGPDSLRLDGLHVHTAPLSLDGALEIFDDKRWNLALEEATLRNQGIEWLVTRVPGIPVVAMAGASSEGVLRKVRLGRDSAKGFFFAGGTIDVSDVGLNLKGGYRLDGIRGAITVENDTYQLADFSNGPVEASGSMTVDYATDTVRLNLAGKLNLGPKFPLPEAVAHVLRADAGVVSIPEFEATFIQGKVQLPSLRIAAALENGAVSVYDKRRDAFTTATGVQGEAAFTEGALHITRIKGPHSEFSGTLTPDETLQRWAVSSTFTSDLSSPLWAFLQPATVTIQGGKLECTRLEGTFVRGQKTPETLALEATAKDVTLALQSGGFKDALHLASVALKSTASELAYDAAGTSGMLGPFTAQGTYTLASGAVDTQARVRLNEAVALPETWRVGVAGTVLQALAEVPLRVRYGGAGSALEITSDEPLSMKGTLDFAAETGTRAPFGLSLAANLPAAWLAPHLSAAVEPSGIVKVAATIASADGKLAARADFSGAALGWSILEKKVDFPAAISLSGGWSGGRARLTGGQVEAGGERIPFTLKDGAPSAEQVAIALEPLAPLLPEGATLRGRVSGSYAGESGAILLEFDRAHALLAPDLLPLELDGGIARRGGGWRVENLAWAIGASRGSFQATETGGMWQGRVQASRIHASELRQGYQAWNARRGMPEDKGERPWDFSGDIEVAADTLVWAEAILEKVHGVAHFSPGAVQVGDLVAVHGTGQIAGAAGYVSTREGNPAVLSTDLTVSGVDAVLLEGLFLEKARGLAGLMNARVALTIPLIAENPSVMHAMSGEITFEGRDGTLGKAGLASKLLGALRTTDILRLRVPQLKDKGLSFKTLSGRVLIDQGVFRVDPFSLSDSAYVLVAKATFDYPKDTAGGGGEIQVLEGVTGMARKIPILGDAANLVSKVFGIPIKVSGTAKDPTFGVGVAAPLKESKAP